jgi:chemotaxis protein MotB
MPDKGCSAILIPGVKHGCDMAGQSNVAPIIIIKRKKVIQGGGHHGGAWKVAYADFVTAMMAFFMLMWLLNATTEKQRKGIADYFSPTIAVARISGGGDGMFGGDSSFSEMTQAKVGTGAEAQKPTESNAARGASSAQDAAAAEAEKAKMAEIEQALSARGGESMTMQRMLKHVVTKVTDEGMVIEIFDLPDAPLFVDETAEPTGETRKISALIAEVLGMAENQVAVSGHLRTLPITLKDNPNWELSAARAQAMRMLLEGAKFDTGRIDRISGFADRKPATQDPTAIRNNRLEVILLRKNR